MVQWSFVAQWNDSLIPVEQYLAYDLATPFFLFPWFKSE